MSKDAKNAFKFNWIVMNFWKMSKLQGVKNAHRWLHMVRLTQSSTKFCCDFSKNFEVQKCAWNRIILHRVHALLRDPLRGGRDHFTERKIDQIRGRLGKFGDLLTEIMRFQGFWWFVFYLVFKICWNFQSFSECRLIVFILMFFFQFFEGSKHAILGKNHRQGSRTWWSRRFYWDKIRSNPQSVW